jgi:hypothetical protein
VVGALAVARLCEALGTPFVLGGVAWERVVIDPQPGPRPLDQIRGGRALGDHALLASPETATESGVAFSEARMASHLGTGTVLVDVSGGAVGAQEGIEAACSELGCDLVVAVDVGGDVLAHGDEAGLASPLCDAVMVAAAWGATGRIRPVLGVIGPGCDGELSVADVLRRVAELGRAGAWLGTWGVTPAVADELEAAAAIVPTEASLQVVRCARGELGTDHIRQGRRQVELGPLGALAFLFDATSVPHDALPLAAAVTGSESIEAARAALAALGVRTELDYERTRAGEGP